MPNPPENPPDTSGFPFSPQDAMAFMQKLWNPFGVPMPGFNVPGTTGAAPAPAVGGFPFPNPATLFASLDPAEVERKIGELRVIEGWLQMTLSMMQMSIKTMELQKASLEAMRAPPQRTETPAPASKRSKS